MKTIWGLVTATILALAGLNAAYAVPPDKDVSWDTPMGKVTFYGKVHAGRGIACTECHMDLFQMKAHTAKITMADINAGKFCGHCHNGTRAFDAKDANNCKRCHKQ